MSALQSLVNLRTRALSALAKLTWFPPLLCRVSLGLIFAPSGWGKVHNLAKVTEYFTTLGIPMPGLNAWFVGGLEMVGGALLLLGLFSRPIAFLLTGNMLVADLTADRPALFGVLQDLEAFLRADPFWFLFVSVVVLTLGPGAISLDRFVTKMMQGPQADTAAGR